MEQTGVGAGRALLVPAALEYPVRVAGPPGRGRVTHECFGRMALELHRCADKPTYQGVGSMSVRCGAGCCAGRGASWTAWTWPGII